MLSVALDGTLHLVLWHRLRLSLLKALELLPRPPSRHRPLRCLGLFIIVDTDGPQLVGGQSVEDASSLAFVYFIYRVVYIVEDFGYFSLANILFARRVFG
jgi:hypothetical protein